MFKSLESSGKQLPALGLGKLHNKNRLEKIFRDEASMVLKESMYTAQCIAKKGREGEGGSEGC